MGACNPTRKAADFSETDYLGPHMTNYAAPSVPRTPHPNEWSTDVRDAWDEPGVLADSAASIIMKVMYGARMARFDLLRAVQGLARFMTKWTRRQDQELWKLMCYIQATKHWRLVGWVGDPLQNITPTVFSDADFAGCIETRRCTSGGFCCLRGPNTSFPISAVSKRQGSMSNSTTEAELSAAQTAIGRMGIPLLVLWSHISEQCGADPLGLAVLLDNTAMLEIIRTGRNLTVRHIGKTHGVAVSWLHELYKKKDVVMKYITTTMMAADLYTKAFTEPSKWAHMCVQNNLFPSVPSKGEWP